MKIAAETITIAGKPDLNQNVYSDELLKEVVRQLNEKEYPVTLGYYRGSSEMGVPLSQVAGATVPGTAEVNNRKVKFQVNLIRDISKLIKHEFVFGMNLDASIKETIDGVKYVDPNVKLISYAIIPISDSAQRGG